jgi:hypothetical protein
MGMWGPRSHAAATSATGQRAAPKATGTFCCGTFIINSLAWNLLFATTVRGRLLRPDVDAATITRIRRACIAGPLVCALATVLALLQPLLGLS